MTRAHLRTLHRLLPLLLALTALSSPGLPSPSSEVRAARPTEVSTHPSSSSAPNPSEQEEQLTSQTPQDLDRALEPVLDQLHTLGEAVARLEEAVATSLQASAPSTSTTPPLQIPSERQEEIDKKTQANFEGELWSWGGLALAILLIWVAVFIYNPGKYARTLLETFPVMGVTGTVYGLTRAALEIGRGRPGVDKILGAFAPALASTLCFLLFYLIASILLTPLLETALETKRGKNLQKRMRDLLPSFQSNSKEDSEEPAQDDAQLSE